MIENSLCINKGMVREIAVSNHSNTNREYQLMSIYRDTFAEAMGMRPLPQDVLKRIIEEPIPEDAETKRGGWFSTGNQWCVETMGPMIKGVHLQTLTGDERTEAQKEAARKHSEYQKKNAITPTAKGSKLSEEHKQALCKPKKSMSFKEYECPHCGKKGRGNSMVRWHMDNCKMKSGDY